VSVEGGFPLIAWSNADEIVSTAEIDFGVDLRVAEVIEEVGNEGNGVTILLGDLVKATPVDTESERTVLLLDKKNGSTAVGLRLANKSSVEVLLEELSESFGLGL
jgi:hypothetical protein